MSAMASQITRLTIVHSTVYSRCRSKETSKLRITGLCDGNSPSTGEFPAQRACNAQNVSIWWRHHRLGLSDASYRSGRIIWNSNISGDLIGGTTWSKWAPLRDLLCANEIYFSYKIRRETSCFGVNRFFKEELVPWCLYGDNFPLCTNRQMNGKIQ